MTGTSMTSVYGPWAQSSGVLQHLRPTLQSVLEYDQIEAIRHVVAAQNLNGGVGWKPITTSLRCKWVAGWEAYIRTPDWGAVGSRCDQARAICYLCLYSRLSSGATERPSSAV